MQEPSLGTIGQAMQEIWAIRMQYEDKIRLEDDPRRKSKYQKQAEMGKKYYDGLEKLVGIVMACIRTNPSVAGRRRRSDDLISNMIESLDLIASYLLQILENTDDPMKCRRAWREVQNQLGLFQDYLKQFIQIVPVTYQDSTALITALPAPEGV